MQNLKTFLLHMGNISHHTSIRYLPEIVDFCPSISSWPLPATLAEELLKSLGATHEDALKFTRANPLGSLEAMRDTYFNKWLQFRKFQDSPVEDWYRYYRGSLTSPQTHMYHFETQVGVTGAATMSAKDYLRRYALRDISTFPGWKGILFLDDPKQKAMLDHYNSLSSDLERKEYIKNVLEPIGMKNYEDCLKQGIIPENSAFVMDKSIALVRGFEEKIMKNSEGKDVRIFCMLLQPSETHAFAGYILHAYAITGPNTITPFVIGGGTSNVPGLDFVNSYVAPVMWAITKFTNAALEDFQQRQARGEIAAQVKWEDHFWEHHQNLVDWWKFLKLVVGEGGKVSIFLNKFLGRPNESAPTFNEYKMREIPRDSDSRLDLTKVIFYEPFGDRVYDGHEEIVDAKDAKDGIFFENKRIDAGFSNVMEGKVGDTSSPESMDAFEKIESSHLADDVRKLIDQRMSDIRLSSYDVWRKYYHAESDAFFKKHPELNEKDVGKVKDRLYAELANKIAGKVEGEIKKVEPQLVGDLKKTLETKSFIKLQMEQLREVVRKKCYQNLILPMVEPEGDFMQPELERMSTYFKCQISLKNQQIIKDAIIKQDLDTASFTQQIADIHKVDPDLTSPDNKKRVDELETYRAISEAESHAKQKDLERERDQHKEYLERMKHAEKKIEHYESKIKHGK